MHLRQTAKREIERRDHTENNGTFLGVFFFSTQVIGVIVVYIYVINLNFARIVLCVEGINALIPSIIFREPPTLSFALHNI